MPHSPASNYALPPGQVSWPDSSVLVNFYASTSSALVALFLYTRFVLEPLAPRVYGDVYNRLTISERRSFICHHAWLSVKLLCCAGAWPLLNIIFLHKSIFEPIAGGSITNGDLLSVLFSMIIASFCYELLYRIQISPVSMIHHIAGITLASWQISTELSSTPFSDNVQIPDAQDTYGQSSQFRLIMIYGLFEVVFESWMHFCSILYKCYKGNPAACALIWGSGGLYVLLGSLAELGCMIALWHKYWHGWSIEYKVAMPILHMCFMAAQLHGARVGLSLRRRFLREALEAKERAKPTVQIDFDQKSMSSFDSMAKTTLSEEPVTPILPLDAFRRSSVVQPSPTSTNLSRRIPVPAWPPRCAESY